MSAIRFVTRASIRRQWRGLVVVTLLIGLAGAAVMTAAAGARRTSTALDRFRSYSRSGDLEIDLGSPDPNQVRLRNATPEQLAALRAVPGVEGVGRLWQFTITDPSSTDGSILPIAAAVDGSFGRDVDRPLLVHGRLPDPKNPLELAVGETIARQFHLKLGQHLTLGSYSPAQIKQIEATQAVRKPTGPVVGFDIVGIVRRPLDLGVRGASGGVLVPTPAFYRRYKHRIGSYVDELLRVRVAGGQAGVPAVTKAAHKIFPQDDFAVVGVGTDTEGARDAIRVLTAALWIFTGVAAAAGLTVIGIVVVRQISSQSGDQLMLSALGLTRHQRAVTQGLPAVPVALAGAILAIMGAVLASPLLPFGVARRADVNPGFHADLVVLGLGLLAVVGFVVAIGFAAAWRMARASNRSRIAEAAGRPSAAARIAASAGASPRLTTGLRMALEPGSGATSVPVRSAFFGAGLGALGIVAVLVFSASLNNLIATPQRYGWTWDAVLYAKHVSLAKQTKVCGDVHLPTSLTRPFAALSAICEENFQVDGHPTEGWGFRSLRGDIEPAIAAGRAPRTPDEVALGASVLDQIHKGIGDTVTVSGDGGSRRYTVVGQVVLPTMQAENPEPLAGGAALTSIGFSRLLPKKYNPDVNIVATVAPGARVQYRSGHRMYFNAEVQGTGRLVPVEISRINQIGHLPAVLAALLGLLAVVAVGQAIVLGMRRRRRDVVVLRTIGFERRDVRVTIAYQSAVLTGLGLAVGVPFGIIAGRLVWTSVARGLGVAPVTAVPGIELVLLGVGALVLALFLGALAASLALRDSPGAILSRE